MSGLFSITGIGRPAPMRGRIGNIPVIINHNPSGIPDAQGPDFPSDYFIPETPNYDGLELIPTNNNNNNMTGNFLKDLWDNNKPLVIAVGAGLAGAIYLATRKKKGSSISGRKRKSTKKRRK